MRGPIRAAALLALTTLAAAFAQEATPPAAAPSGFKPPPTLVRRRNGVKEFAANAAIAAGIDWIRRHVSKDGHWGCDAFGDACVGAKCAGRGVPGHDVGITGLATLALLGAGSTQAEGQDAGLIHAALQYLEHRQDANGCFGPRTSQHFLYDHAAATMALAEALWLTGDESLVVPVTKARDFLLAAQHSQLGWRYTVPSDGDVDTASTTWCALALRTCQFARLDVPDAAYGRTVLWYQRMAEPEFGNIGYLWRGGSDARVVMPAPPSSKPQPPAKDGSPGGAPLTVPSGSPVVTDAPIVERSGVIKGQVPLDVLSLFPPEGSSSCTAMAGCVISLTTYEPMDDYVRTCGKYLGTVPPSFKKHGLLDLHSMLFGCLLDAQSPIVGKPPEDAASKKTWRPWRDAVVADLASTQVKKGTGCAAGSWNPEADPYGIVGGRVYATAMAVLALQAPNRFPKVWDPKVKARKPPEYQWK